MITIRNGAPADEFFLKEMTYQAIYSPKGGGFLPRNAYSATPGPPAQGWGHGWLSSRACLNAAQEQLAPVLVVGGRPPKSR